MGKRRKTNTEQDKSRFQEVRQDGSAAARAETAKAGDEEDDDVDFIRKKNENAVLKRQKKSTKKSSKASEATSAAAEPASKAEKKKVKNAKTQKASAAESRGKQKKQRSHQKADDDDPKEESDSEDEDEEEEEELAMEPSHYRNQEGYRFEDESGEGSDFEELNVVFDHFYPKEEDFHGIRQFFKNYLGGTVFDVSGLVDLIISQSGAVGTTIKVAGESEVYGVTSVVSFKYHQDLECMKQIGRFIISKCPSEQRSVLEKIIGTGGKSNTGLILSERMVNMPPEMALPLMNALFDEIKWSQEDQPESERDKFKFDKYVILTRVLRFSASKRSKGKKGRAADVDVEEECVYLKAEDQVLRSLAELEFEFRMADREEDEGAASYGLVMVVKASQGDRVVDMVKELVGDEALRNQIDLDAPV